MNKPDSNEPTTQVTPSVTDTEPPASTGHPEPRMGSGHSSASMVFAHQRIQWGPIPPASELRAYGEVNPEYPERIIALAEREQQHRHELERSAIKYDAGWDQADMRYRFRGQTCALVVALAAFIAAVTLGLFGEPWSGGLLGSTTIVGLVTAFILGNRSTSPEEDQPGE